MKYELGDRVRVIEPRCYFWGEIGKVTHIFTNGVLQVGFPDGSRGGYTPREVERET